MDPIQISVPCAKGPRVFLACATCGHPFEGPSEYAEHAARRCCDPRCERCGTSNKKFELYCPTCWVVVAAEREAERFAKARKITPAEYGEGMVYWDGRGPQEGYFSSAEDVLEHCEAHGLARPSYVWGCERHPLSINAASVIESACDDMYSDAASEIPDAAVKRFQDFINEWCGEQGIVSWHLDYDVAIVLDAATAGVR